MKKGTLVAVLILLCFSQALFAQKGKWTILFDGTSTDKLRGYNMQTFPADAWKVEDGALATQTGVPNIDLVTKEAL